MAGTTSADSGFICSWIYRGTDSCSDSPSASTALRFVTVTLMITSPREAPVFSLNTTVMPHLSNAVTVISVFVSACVRACISADGVSVTASVTAPEDGSEDGSALAPLNRSEKGSSCLGEDGLGEDGLGESFSPSRSA